MTHVDIPFLRYLDEEGRPVATLPTWLDKAILHTFYCNMVMVRSYDKKAIALQRTGKLGTFPSHLGAEAVGIGVGLAMQPQDVYVPYYRDMPTLYVRGVPMEKNLQYWGGDERGSVFYKADGELSEDLPICVPIATQITHAAGIAAAFKLRNQPRVAVVTIGDGGTSKGDFLEGLNCAGVWHLPMVMIINNNQWAISVPRKLQSSAPTLAQKGIGAGVRSIQVDGNDVVAVYEATRSAVERARSGKGPTLIEAVSYRLGITPRPTMRPVIGKRPRWKPPGPRSQSSGCASSCLHRAGGTSSRSRHCWPRRPARSSAPWPCMKTRRRRPRKPCLTISLPSCRRITARSASASSPRACSSTAGRKHE